MRLTEKGQRGVVVGSAPTLKVDIGLSWRCCPGRIAVEVLASAYVTQPPTRILKPRPRPRPEWFVRSLRSSAAADSGRFVHLQRHNLQIRRVAILASAIRPRRGKEGFAGFQRLASSRNVNVGRGTPPDWHGYGWNGWHVRRRHGGHAHRAARGRAERGADSST